MVCKAPLTKVVFMTATGGSILDDIDTIITYMAEHITTDVGNRSDACRYAIKVLAHQIRSGAFTAPSM